MILRGCIANKIQLVDQIFQQFFFFQLNRKRLCHPPEMKISGAIGRNLEIPGINPLLPEGHRTHAWINVHF